MVVMLGLADTLFSMKCDEVHMQHIVAYVAFNFVVVSPCDAVFLPFVPTYCGNYICQILYSVPF